MPPEFDVVDEMKAAMPLYEDYISSSFLAEGWRDPGDLSSVNAAT
jgi:hypothetical protein